MTVRAISYGGGVQSTALLVLAVQGIIDFPVALFANVGDDSENPGSIEFVEKWAKPYAADKGYNLIELHKTRRDGTPVTLHADLLREQRSINIPVRMANGAPGNRNCTHTFKIAVVDKWLKANGASKTDNAVVAIGFSTDELERANTKRTSDFSIPTYPLLDLGHDRSACAQIIRDAGLPVPPKSSCYFCPYQKPQTWAEKRRDQPDLFWKSVELESTLNRRRDSLGKDHVYMTRFGKPLDEAISEAQQPLFADGPEGCDDGYCWT
jgi:hypothetical protein